MSSIIEGIKVIIARLETVTVANGCSIDLVGKVVVDEESVDLDGLPIAMLFTGEVTEQSRGGNQITWLRRMSLDVMDKVPPRDPEDLGAEDEWLSTERMMDDIHKVLIAPELNKACTNQNIRLDGTVKSFKISAGTFSLREDGHRVKGVSVDIEVEYITQYASHSLA